MALNIRDLKISSPDIAAGASIDPKFSAMGGNQIPRIEVHGVPSDAVELAIVLNDPDAPLPNGFTHWVVLNIPAVDGLIDFDSAIVGKNGIGETSYTGPQPPQGHGVHHYYFWVYALDKKVDQILNREDFLKTYAENIVEQSRFVSTFINP